MENFSAVVDHEYVYIRSDSHAIVVMYAVALLMHRHALARVRKCTRRSLPRLERHGQKLGPS